MMNKKLKLIIAGVVATVILSGAIGFGIHHRNQVLATQAQEAKARENKLKPSYNQEISMELEEDKKIDAEKTEETKEETKTDGTEVKEETKTDGSIVVTETKKDGTVTKTFKSSTGKVTQSVKRAGSSSFVAVKPSQEAVNTVNNASKHVSKPSTSNQTASTSKPAQNTTSNNSNTNNKPAQSAPSKPAEQAKPAQSAPAPAPSKPAEQPKPSNPAPAPKPVEQPKPSTGGTFVYDSSLTNSYNSSYCKSTYHGRKTGAFVNALTAYHNGSVSAATVMGETYNMYEYTKNNYDVARKYWTESGEVNKNGYFTEKGSVVVSQVIVNDGSLSSIHSQAVSAGLDKTPSVGVSPNRLVRVIISKNSTTGKVKISKIYVSMFTGFIDDVMIHEPGYSFN